MSEARSKLLVLLAARGGAGRDAIRQAVLAERAEIEARLASCGGSVQALLRVERDILAQGGANMRGFEATLDLGCAAADPAALVDAVAGAAARLAPWVHVDLCAVLVGVDHAIVPCDPTPIRFQYLMRRRADLDHAAYVKHYREIHAKIGERTPGIRGYVQFHVDPQASREAASGAGLGLWTADSVSELHLDSLEGFVAAVSKWEEGGAAIADERNFVDRENSVMFSSESVA